MQFFKKHYEKIIFSTVLTLLAAAAGWLSFQAKVEQTNIANATKEISEAPPIPVEPLKFEPFDAALKKVKTPPYVDLSISNHVFNPVKWVQTPPPDEKLIALRNGDEISSQMDIRKLTPLNLIVSFEPVTGSGDSLKYVVGIFNQMDPRKRTATATADKMTVASTNERPNRFFALKSIKGAGNEAELGLELKDETELITISKGKPYVRPMGFAVDLAYKLEPGNRSVEAPQHRVGDTLNFGNDSYKIVAINEKEVVIESSTGKRYTIRAKLP